MKIYFCFPYKKIGGVSMVFLRLSMALAKKGYDCCLVDYIDGCMALRKPDGVALLEYRDDEFVFIPNDGIVIFQSMTPWSIFPSLVIDPATKVFFWNCHPFNLVPTLPGIRSTMKSHPRFGKFIIKTILNSYRNKLIRLINHLCSMDALIFMDRTNLKVTEQYLDFKLASPVLLSIPLLGRSLSLFKGYDVSSKKIRITWIGRIVDFKYFILKRALIDLNAFAQNFPSFRLEITIIGQGDALELLVSDVVRLDKVQVKFVDYIDSGRLPGFLAAETDMLMAMGSSALEGARVGIPTLLLDLSYRDVGNGYRYQWLSDRDGYTLGDYIDDEHFIENNESLAARLFELIHNSSRVSSRAKSYYDSHHSTESVVKKFASLVSKSNCIWGDLERLNLTGKDSLYSLFVWIRKKYR